MRNLEEVNIESTLPTPEEKVCLDKREDEGESCAMCSKTGDTDIWTGILQHGAKMPSVKSIKAINLPYYRLIAKVGKKTPKDVHNGSMYDLFGLRSYLVPIIFRLDERVNVNIGTYRAFRPKLGWAQERYLRRKVIPRKKGIHVMRYSVCLTLGGKSVYPSRNIVKMIIRKANFYLKNLRSYCLLVDPSIPLMSDTTAADIVITPEASSSITYLDPITGSKMITDVDGENRNNTVSGESVFVSEMIPIIPYLCSKNIPPDDVHPYYIDCQSDAMLVKNGKLYVQILGSPTPIQTIRRGYIIIGQQTYSEQYNRIKDRVKEVLEWLRSKNAVALEGNPSEEYIKAWRLRSFIKDVWPQSSLPSFGIFITDWTNNTIGDLRETIKTGGESISINLPPLEDSNGLSDKDWVLLPELRSRKDKEKKLIKDLSSTSGKNIFVINGRVVFSATSSSEVETIIGEVYRLWLSN